MKYQIITTIFTGSGRDKDIYRALLNGFIKSVNTNCKNVTLRVMQLPPITSQKKVKTNKGIAYMRTDNYYKLRCLGEVVSNIEVPTIIIDADTIVLKDLCPIFTDDFDVAITVKRNDRNWLNAGVIAMYPTEKAKKLFSSWVVYDDKVYHDHELKNKLRRETGVIGQNQTSFAGHYKQLRKLACIKELPCEVWNNCDATWNSISSMTAVVHVKGNLRNKVIGKKSSDHNARKAYEVVKKYYQL